jgi:hypothetical protein
VIDWDFAFWGSADQEASTQSFIIEQILGIWLLYSGGRIIMSKTIYGVISEMIELSQKPVKALAKEVGKPYPTLMRELNAEDQGAKLGVELLLPLMKACQSVLPLRFLASRMDHRVVSLKHVTPDKSSLLEEMLTTYPSLAEFHQAIMEGAPLEKVAELREHVILQVQEDFVAYTRKFEEK